MLPLTYTLETERCRLRAPSESDLPAIFEASREPGFCDGMAWSPPATLEEMREPLRQNLERWRQGQSFTFTIEDKATGEFLGRISIRNLGKPGVWNIGYFLHPRHQGRGYMTEAGRAVMRLGFEALGAEEIEACCTLWNRRSERVLQRLRMTFVEYVPEGLKKGDTWVPENRMSRRRSASP